MNEKFEKNTLQYLKDEDIDDTLKKN
jgi:hypothetical protein